MINQQMKNVRDDLIKVEKTSLNESIKSLLDLDVMRTNIINAQVTLQVDFNANLQSQFGG